MTTEPRREPPTPLGDVISRNVRFLLRPNRRSHEHDQPDSAVDPEGQSYSRYVCIPLGEVISAINEIQSAAAATTARVAELEAALRKLVAFHFSEPNCPSVDANERTFRQARSLLAGAATPPASDSGAGLDVERLQRELAETLHDAMCDISHHDRDRRCSKWGKYPNIAASVAPRLAARLAASPSAGTAE